MEIIPKVFPIHLMLKILELQGAYRKMQVHLQHSAIMLLTWNVYKYNHKFQFQIRSDIILSEKHCLCQRARKAIPVFSFTICCWLVQAGKELMLCLQEDKLKAEMLSSLSKLAFDSSTLAPQQVLVLSCLCSSTFYTNVTTDCM